MRNKTQENSIKIRIKKDSRAVPDVTGAIACVKETDYYWSPIYSAIYGCDRTACFCLFLQAIVFLRSHNRESESCNISED